MIRTRNHLMILMRCTGLLLVLALATTPPVLALVPEQHEERKEVIYGRKHGFALTMFIYPPAGKPNGIGLIYLPSGGYHSTFTRSFPPSDRNPFRHSSDALPPCSALALIPG